jgi:hypothetical protein
LLHIDYLFRIIWRYQSPNYRHRGDELLVGAEIASVVWMEECPHKNFDLFGIAAAFRQSAAEIVGAEVFDPDWFR